MKLTYQDLFHIVSDAKQGIVRLPATVHITNQKVEECDFKHIALVNSLIMCLNRKQVLKELVEFDYTDHSCEYETDEDFE